MWCKGRVQGNVVVLEDGASLPEGTDVMVMAAYAQGPDGGEIPPKELAQRQALVAQMQAFGQRLAGRHMCLSDALLAGREEL